MPHCIIREQTLELRTQSQISYSSRSPSRFSVVATTATWRSRLYEDSSIHLFQSRPPPGGVHNNWHRWFHSKFAHAMPRSKFPVSCLSLNGLMSPRDFLCVIELSDSRPVDSRNGLVARQGCAQSRRDNCGIGLGAGLVCVWANDTPALEFRHQYLSCEQTLPCVNIA